MKRQNIEFRSVIKSLTKEDANAKEIQQLIADVYGDRSPSIPQWQRCQQNLNVG